MADKGKLLSAEALASWFINRTERASGDEITQLKLQKLVYYADAWFLANFDRPLIANQFQAWAHGPVVAALWQRYRGHAWEALPPEHPKPIDREVKAFLEAVYKEYGQFTAKRLEQLTHSEEPWVRTRGNLPPEAKCTKVIDKLLIRNYYAGKIGKKAITKLPN